MSEHDAHCPYCRTVMRSVKMHCQACSSSVEGFFKTSRLAMLPAEESAFLAEFVLAGFSIKKLEKRVGMSYPAIRSRLDKVIESMRDLSATAAKRKKILEKIESGELQVDAAIQEIERM